MPVHLRHIVAAVDDTDVSRHALRQAARLAADARARLTVLRVDPNAGRAGDCEAAELSAETRVADQSDGLQRLRRWVAPELRLPVHAPARIAVAYGIPGVEIPRCAERHGADLLVLGRRQRTHTARLLLGDTADAVARRSNVSCLLVTEHADVAGPIVAALDGSQRGLVVLEAALELSRATGGRLGAVTVEPSWSGEPAQLAEAVPAARSLHLATVVDRASARSGQADASLLVERGPVVEAIMQTVVRAGARVLAIGWHRGGPAGIVEGGSTARRLAHAAPCAVLTVPL